MTFLGLEARAALPKVSYPTALDHFIFISFVFIFATIVQVISISQVKFKRFLMPDGFSPPQFAFVHTFTKYGFGETYYFYDDEKNKEEHPKAPPSSPAVPPVKQNQRKEERQLVFSIDNHLLNPPVNETAITVQPTPTETPIRKRRKQSNSHQHPPGWGGRQMNSVSKIDKISRVFFPILFITINFIYWYSDD